MPRSNRLPNEGGIFHVTHRCHNREFLLKFARDRHAYRAKLRERLADFEVSLLDYCITSNHVHLLVDADDRLEVSGLMREVAGQFAREYNRRKGRQNAFWGDTFHAALVESGEYLWQCLCYVELNMVRCGVVSHPSQWEWLGYHEIAGQRRRYRLLDVERLCWRLRTRDLDAVRRNLAASVQDRIARDEVRREPQWTESLAVGTRNFVERIQPLILSRRETELIQTDSAGWVLRECEIPYKAISASKIGCKAPK